jgi:cytochrome b subunit of formate dehydrogenase
MTPGAVRRIFHATHAAASLLLIATGLLLWDADLRARLIGGYGRQILETHLWLGSGLLVAPVLAGLVAGGPLLRDLARRLGPPDPPFAWVKVHIVGSLVMTLLLGGSGLLLWADLDLSPAVLDLATAVHLALTWLLAASIPIHLVLARRKIVLRAREILGLVSASELGTSFFDQDDS